MRRAGQGKAGSVAASEARWHAAQSGTGGVTESTQARTSTPAPRQRQHQGTHLVHRATHTARHGSCACRTRPHRAWRRTTTARAAWARRSRTTRTVQATASPPHAHRCAHTPHNHARASKQPHRAPRAATYRVGKQANQARTLRMRTGAHAPRGSPVGLRRSQSHTALAAASAQLVPQRCAASRDVGPSDGCEARRVCRRRLCVIRCQLRAPPQL